MIKTSKVKYIEEVKQWGQGDRLTYYHNLECENGDEINIGKKSQLKIGDEITYEITGELGQHKFTKAKAMKKEEFNQPNKDSYVKGIEVGHAINNAVNMLCAGVEFKNVDSDLSTGKKIEAYARNIMVIAERLKNE